MNLVDRFVCRREGHLPSLTLKTTGTISVSSYICQCVRCKKFIEVTPSAGREGTA